MAVLISDEKEYKENNLDLWIEWFQLAMIWAWVRFNQKVFGKMIPVKMKKERKNYNV